jgi:hypothetical protein
MTGAGCEVGDAKVRLSVDRVPVPVGVAGVLEEGVAAIDREAGVA